MDANIDGTFACRMQDYLSKAMREAKVHTSWTSPRADYEKAVQEFVGDILSPEKSETFLQDFRSLERRISPFGMLNSLSQTLIRLTAPGVPDTYQGTELWDLSLVDPDNRRPVDYERRRRYLDEITSRFDNTTVLGAGIDRIKRRWPGEAIFDLASANRPAESSGAFFVRRIFAGRGYRTPPGTSLQLPSPSGRKMGFGARAPIDGPPASCRRPSHWRGGLE